MATYLRNNREVLLSCTPSLDWPPSISSNSLRINDITDDNLPFSLGRMHDVEFDQSANPYNIHTIYNQAASHTNIQNKLQQHPTHQLSKFTSTSTSVSVNNQTNGSTGSNSTAVNNIDMTHNDTHALNDSSPIKLQSTSYVNYTDDIINWKNNISASDTYTQPALPTAAGSAVSVSVSVPTPQPQSQPHLSSSAPVPIPANLEVPVPVDISTYQLPVISATARAHTYSKTQIPDKSYVQRLRHQQVDKQRRLKLRLSIYKLAALLPKPYLTDGRYDQVSVVDAAAEFIHNIGHNNNYHNTYNTRHTRQHAPYLHQ